ncbi:MAG: heavy-metal-associated domain-containing protein [Ignavibacteriae bacterium]|nr:heavy-metal-associated domain-containing protein [Ignavibacteriota bacterium]MCB9214254.1 heavy-metal-associated domain-containing protein [Ignavibacteria bacterium]
MNKSVMLKALLVTMLCGGFVSSSLVAGTEVAQKKRERTITISVPEMQCGMCEARIEKGLKKIDGVKSVKADAEENTVVVTYDTKKTSKSKIEEAIANLGYDAGEKEANESAQSQLSPCCKPGGHE